MMPYILKIGPFTIFSYGLMLACAFFLGAYLASQRGRKEGFNAEEIFNFLFFVFIFGIIGCRVLYVLITFGFYLRNPLEILMIQRGGMAWFGGLLLGSAAGIIYLKRKNLPILKVLDLVVPFVALGQAIGRIGCFLNGCCYGKVSQCGVYFPSLNEIRLPTQIYSAFLLVVIFMILRLLQEKKHQPGEIVASYFFLYALKRFIMEFFRGDNTPVFFGLTIFQLFSLGFLSLSLGIFIYLRVFKAKEQ